MKGSFCVDKEAVIAMLERQAEWQESRKSLSWEEKLAIAARLRDSVVAWRESGKGKRTAEEDEARGD